MDEGPEPQEWVERSVEHHHEAAHEQGGDEARSGMLLRAIMAAVLAVLASLGSLLSGHAANQAILFQTKASNQWSYFQSKSTKGHLYEVSRDVVRVLSEAQGTSQAPQVGPALVRFQEQVERYDREKDDIRHQAEQLERESRHEFHKHHQYAVGVALFQVGIVLASISILVRYRAILGLGLLAGCAGIAFTLLGLSA